MAPRLAALVLCALVAAPAAQAAPAPPQNVRAFLLGSDETPAAGRTYARTPSFAWNKVAGTRSYDFELATSSRFTDNAVVWRTSGLTSPLTTVPITLPWTTGSPYSFYARVRARTVTGTTPWSSAYGFKLKAPAAPVSLSSGLNSTPGMIRWTPVDGATAYQVTFLYSLGTGEKKLIKTATTAADLREYYTLHNLFFSEIGSVIWRVRAVREVSGTTSNRIPAASYGPWSAYASTLDPPISNGPVTPLGAISRSRTSNITSGIPGPGPKAHELVPGFWWDGDTSLDGFGACPPDVVSRNVTCPLYHVYVFTDEDCVNRVHVSDLVGSPAYVPRLSDPLAYPSDPSKLSELYIPYDPIADEGPFYFMLADAASEGGVFDAGGDEVFAAGTDPDLPPLPDPGPGKKSDRRSGLWDNDWPNGHYYWTVVPAVPRITPEQTVEYHDVGFAEDMCQAGQVGTFGKESAPVVEKASGAPVASGMSTAGRVRSATTATPAFFGRIVVSWRPAPGATLYQVQWSRKADPFKAAGGMKTSSTAALLNLPTGVWYYRVRGLDQSIPGTLQGMTWSDPQYVKIVPRSFSVLR
jgi:hypothetical protein